MTPVFEVLTTPVTKATSFGTATLTHRAWGFTHQPWHNDAPITSYFVLGVLNADGTFTPYAGTENYCPIRGADYAAILAANASGKQSNVFRTDDIIAFHKKTNGVV